MKLFKKRDTVGGSSLSTGSPSGSLDRGQSQQSPGGASTSSPSTANGNAATGASPREGVVYPWSIRKVSNNNPFPRYGHATNAQAGKDGNIYLFGGLVKEKAMRDLWTLSSGDLQAQAVATTGEVPTARVGHAALLIGNAFIVFGGDTKLNSADVNPNNDDSLYLLNTSTKVWSVARVAGAKPSGRYGHTLNMLGPKVLVFGGQVEGFFFNDLVAFDLNTLNHAAPRWELISPVDGSEPPPSRTNHVAVTHNDKLYVFGGTNGVEWFNDIWRFDPVTRSWTLLKCSGFVPQPREGHSAALVGDVIYIFGGRDVDGNDLGDLSAFKISSARWFTFQNMGPGPSPRSGHALCSVGKKVFVIGGEGASSRGDEQHAYILDTSKIRFPAEAAAEKGRTQESTPNDVKNTTLDGSPTPRIAPSDPRVAPSDPRGAAPTIRSVSGQGTMAPSKLPQIASQRASVREIQRPLEANGPGSGQSPVERASASVGQRDSQLRRPAHAAQVQQGRNVSMPNPFASAGQAERQQRGEGGNAGRNGLKRSGSLDSMMDLNEAARAESPTRANGASDRAANEVDSKQNRNLNRVRSLEEMRSGPSGRQPAPRQGAIDDVLRPTGVARPAERDSQVLAPALRHLDSGSVERLPDFKPKDPRRNSRRDSMFDSPPAEAPTAASSKRIAWLELELNLARRAGYVPTDPSQTSGEPAEVSEHTEALLALRRQVLALDTEITTARSEAEARASRERAEREEALRELAYERARNEALSSGNLEMHGHIEARRSRELESRLSEIIEQKAALDRRVDMLQSQVDSNERLRADHAELLDRRDREMTEAEGKHAGLLTEHNSLRSAFAEIQLAMQDHQAKRSEAESSLATRSIDLAKLGDLEARHVQHTEALDAVNAATQAATVRASSAEVALDQERQTSTKLQAELADLKAQMEAANAKLARQLEVNRQLEDAVAVTRKEAEGHKLAMTSSLRQLVDHTRSAGPHDPVHHQSTISNLERELSQTRDAHQQTSSMMAMRIQEAEQARDRAQALESASRGRDNELFALQRRLASTQSELETLKNRHSTLTEEHATRQAELAESSVRFSALQQIMNSRPARRDSLEKRRSRNLSSPTASTGRNSQTPDAGRLRELEQKLVESAQLQQEMQASHSKATQEIEALAIRHKESIDRQLQAEQRAKALEDELQGRTGPKGITTDSSQTATAPFSTTSDRELQQAQSRASDAERQLAESTLNFKERLGQLEADYQSAVHYVKGTEKMLRRMKEELGKYKSANAKLISQMEESKGTRELTDGGTQVKDLEHQLATLQTEKGAINSELLGVRTQLAAAVSKVAQLETTVRETQSSQKSVSEHEQRSKQLEDDLEEANLGTKRLEFENRELERRMHESENKVKLLLDQFEASVDTYRRRSTMFDPNSPTDGRPSFEHADHRASAAGSTSDGEALAMPPPNGQLRTSSALDLLANELDQLRNHWESNARSTHRHKTPEIGGDGSLDLDFLGEATPRVQRA